MLARPKKEPARLIHYTPTYGYAPEHTMSFDEILAHAKHRHDFHRRLAWESKDRVLDYLDIRTLSINFRIPFDNITPDKAEMWDDHLEHFSLLMVSQRSEEEKEKFAEAEARLMLYRLRAHDISILQIADYFWTDPSVRTDLMAGCESYEGGERFRLSFEVAFEFLPPSTLDVRDGVVYLSIDQVYEIVVEMFRRKILRKIENMQESMRQNWSLLSALGDAFAELVKPAVSLEHLDEMYRRSFPPCMFRIFTVLKRGLRVSFKGHMELALFLKGIGLDFYAQAEFWSKFKTRLDLTTLYGMDGHGQDYSPHSCVTMITKESPGGIYPVQGCPLRRVERSDMQHYLREMGRRIQEADLEELGLKIPQHPQIACRMYFDATVPGEKFENAGIRRPVEFCLESEERRAQVGRA
jgi:DNA primase large subunit